MQIVMPRGELQVHAAKDNGILRDAISGDAKDPVTIWVKQMLKTRSTRRRLFMQPRLHRPKDTIGSGNKNIDSSGYFRFS